MKCLYPVICTNNVRATKEFYLSLFDFKVIFEAEWYVQLCASENESLHIAFIEQSHPSVPVKYQNKPQGIVLTFEFTDVDKLYHRARQLGIPVVYEICDEDWGQRHFMTVDPNGLLLDVVQLIKPSEAFLKEHGLLK